MVNAADVLARDLGLFPLAEGDYTLLSDLRSLETQAERTLRVVSALADAILRRRTTGRSVAGTDEEM